MRYTKHKRLQFALVGLVILAVGFLGWRQWYIQSLRTEFNKAEVAIKNVATDLKAQGIETEFSRGCGRTQGVYDSGSLSCSVGITYTDIQENRDARDVIRKFVTATEKEGFVKKSGSLNLTSTDLGTGSEVYTLSSIEMRCNLIYTNPAIDTNDQLDLYCGKPARFNPF